VEYVAIPGINEPVPIYPKPNGYFYLILQAFQRYLNALELIELWGTQGRPEFSRRWWQSNRRAMRLYTKRLHQWEDDQREANDEVSTALYDFLRLVLADKYHPERDYTLSEDMFLALPWDAVLNIIEAYRRANNIEDLLKRVIPEYEKKTTDPMLDRVRRAASMRV